MQGNSRVAGRAIRVLRQSRALESMLPPLLLSGVMTLVITAVTRLLWAGLTDNFFQAWMESWLVAWPIAFPVAYLAGPFIGRLAAMFAAEGKPAQRRAPDGPGNARCQT